ncbi:MAG: UvrD-helicase domain-containing protein [Thermomicrobiales bacterium]
MRGRSSAKSEVTFPQLRRRVAKTGTRVWAREDDAVVIDEAQDLQPTTLRMLVSLCESKDRLFLTADPNQSTYGSGFRWVSVHEDLQFRGRTGVLRTNYRSTHQIMAAAGSFLRGAELEISDESLSFPRNGRRPRVHYFATRDEQRAELAGFIHNASAALRLGKSGCAVLVPSESTGVDVALQLRKRIACQVHDACLREAR